MNKKTILSVVIIILALVLGWSLFKVYKLKQPFTEPEDITSFESQEGGQQRLAEFIGFDETQKQEFQILETAYRQNIKTLQLKLEEIQSLIMHELQSEQPDSTTLNNFALQSGAIQTSIKQQTINHFLAVKSMCTPQQLKQFTILFSRMEQRAGRRQGGGGFGPGKRKQFKHGQRFVSPDSIR
ncbi:Spy/CpxP family protein refolding chaperone [Geofilum sp. OHC36d9]|uniref:Spy/CpxP family protein refolding chaperone n=1 Tax=Geofilum sp. OHC36d9 TaxID=3458413 RepID=UPI00403393AF